MDTTQTRTIYYAYATTPDEATAIGCLPDVVDVQEFTVDATGTETYTGGGVALIGATPDAAAMDDILRTRGWTRSSSWDTGSGQHIARVSRGWRIARHGVWGGGLTEELS